MALISNFPPQKCGIATFAGDIVEQLERFAPNIRLLPWRLGDQNAPDSAAGEHIVSRQEQQAYWQAATAINASGADAVWLQHEFGIFGGDCGEMVCDLVESLAPPLMVTLHTVLEHPTALQRSITQRLIRRSSRIMVMSQKSRDLLAENYGASHTQIDVIEHGAPDRPFCTPAEGKKRSGLPDYPRLMTFGLLGPGKGLEAAISAMPRILAAHPSTVYRIAGATHPNLVLHEGEVYRERLQVLAEELGVAQSIEWVNRFLDIDELLSELATCDIYLTPYPNLQQSTSGTLSYAVAVGKAVVSTPYQHACELLGNGAGILIPPHDPKAIAIEVNKLLGDQAELLRVSEAAYCRGRQTIWPTFVQNVEQMINAAITPPGGRHTPQIPAFSAVAELTDDTGLLQHGNGIIAERRHGYCVDDNARALMLTNLVGNAPDDPHRKKALAYAAFIQDAWNPEKRRFRNFMSFSRQWLEIEGSEDSNGRTLWALGDTIAQTADQHLRSWATRLYDQVASELGELGSPRAIAFVVLGALERLAVQPDHQLSRQLVQNGGKLLHLLLNAARRPEWPWFEAVLGYDNARLPQALLQAGAFLEDPEWLQEGLATLRWIVERQTSAHGYFRPIGSESFGKEGVTLPFDQQPLEAQAHIDACLAAHRLDPQGGWLIPARAAYDWFFGRNDRGVVLADPATGRCFDGITPRGLNENSGAESILAFQLASYAFISLAGSETSKGTRGDPSKAKVRNL